MTPDEAITRFAALATPSRLEVMRFLAQQGPEGMASGEIARRLKVAQNTLSTQLLLLSNARMVRQRRSGRSIIYSVDAAAISQLAEFVSGLGASDREGVYGESLRANAEEPRQEVGA